MQVATLPDGPISIDTVVIDAGYYPDTSIISLGLDLQISVDVVDAIGTLIQSVCLKGSEFKC